MLSLPHLVVIFVIALVVFGPQKLPELARTLGKLMAEFRKASGDFRSAFEEEMRDLERQARETERKLKEAARLPALSAISAPAESSTEAFADTGSPTAQESGAGQGSGATIPSSPVVDSPPPSDLSPSAAETSDSHRPDDHVDAQTDNGSSNSLARPNHVDRQPA